MQACSGSDPFDIFVKGGRIKGRGIVPDAADEPLTPDVTLGFEYSGCWAEESRIVVLNACDGANRGAIIAKPRNEALGKQTRVAGS